MAQSKARHVLPLTPLPPPREKDIEKEKEKREEINVRRKKLVHPKMQNHYKKGPFIKITYQKNTKANRTFTH